MTTPDTPSFAPLDRDRVARLCCPQTRQRLSLADEQRVATLNEAIAQGELQNHGGRTLTEPLSMVLIREDGQVAYPVTTFPVLLPEEAITVA